MILNLLRVEELRVEDMMKRSFAELDTQKKQAAYKVGEGFGIYTYVQRREEKLKEKCCRNGEMLRWFICGKRK